MEEQKKKGGKIMKMKRIENSKKMEKKRKKNLKSIGVSDRMGGQGRYWWAGAVMVGRGR